LTEIENLQENCDPASRLLVFLACHGSDEFDGFFMPFDYVKGRYHTAIPMGDFVRLAERWHNPLHVLFIFDCCYSGKALLTPKFGSLCRWTVAPKNDKFTESKVVSFPTKEQANRDTDDEESKMLPLNLPAIQCMTAGASDELADERFSHGGGVFTKYLLDGLRGAAFTQNWLSARRLTAWIAKKMKSDKKVKQVPQFGCLTSGNGEFVFFRP